jgi:hypothetical protein
MPNTVNPGGTKQRYKERLQSTVTKNRYKKALQKKRNSGNREGDSTPLRSFVAFFSSASSKRCFVAQFGRAF